jgi:membrane protein DedA with SNARE-associated domain
VSALGRPAAWWRRQPTRRRVVIAGAAAVAVVVCAAVVLNVVGGDDGLTLVDGSNPGRTYLGVFLLVFLDAVVPIFPGETTLNAAATAAAQGTLELLPVIVAGALGAILGDSTLFWIARRSKGRVAPQLEKARANEKVTQALSLMDSSAPVLIVGGRYVPGMRFVVNATMGLSDIRYRRFLPWSVLGGVLWSTYTCVLAYTIATSLAGFPLASVVISGLVTTVALVVIFWVVRKRRRDTGSPSEGASIA